jgi:lipoprotein-anchoring transpeptidase ErfK/SrfK
MLNIQIWLLLFSPIVITALENWSATKSPKPADTAAQTAPRFYWPGSWEPRLVLVSLTAQRLARYEYGQLIDSLPVSTGKRGHRTPNGDYRVLVKDWDHFSSEYPKPDGGAPMPYAIKFTWRGHWIHAGLLPGHPDSHGCIRLGLLDAKRIFKWVRLGTPIIVKRSFR